MILTELTTVPAAALPVAEFRDHLRLGTGFADSAMQDAVLETCLRAALASIEARTGKALISRSFRWTLTAWRELEAQTLPVAPVSLVTAVKIVDRFGVESLQDADSYWLARDEARPRIVATGLSLPTIPVGGSTEIEFEAGFGATWGDMPADLAQAVMLLSAHFYETRDASGHRASGFPSLVLSLIERYRTVRTLGGGVV